MKKFTFYFCFILITINLKSFAQSEVFDTWAKLTLAIGDVHVVPDTNNQNKTIKSFNLLATGVIFYIKVGNNYLPCLVTAKHIFEDADKNWHPEKLRLRFSNSENIPIDKYFGEEVVLFNGKVKNWYSLPDKNSDIACLPLGKFAQIINNNYMYSAQGFGSYVKICAGLPVTVLGYPFIIEQSEFLRPIMRSGIIAWPTLNPDDTIKAFIDCKLFKGNCGSPVFVDPNYKIMPIGINKTDLMLNFLGIITNSQISYISDIDDNIPQGSIEKHDLSGQSKKRELANLALIETYTNVKRLLLLVQDKLNKK